MEQVVAQVSERGSWSRRSPIGIALSFSLGVMAGSGDGDGRVRRVYRRIRGGLLEHEFHLWSGGAGRAGRVAVYAKRLAAEDPAKIVTALEAIPGVVSAEVHTGSAPEGAAGAGRCPGDDTDRGIEISSARLLVDPFHADLRWPHFGASYHSLFHPVARNFASALANPSVYRDAGPFRANGNWGIQAGVFGVFDTEKRSIDLINADYTFGIQASYRADRLSGFIRIRHQSSHLETNLYRIIPRSSGSTSAMRRSISRCHTIDDLVAGVRRRRNDCEKRPDTLRAGNDQGGVELKSPWLFFGEK